MNREQAYVIADRLAAILNKRDIGSIIYVEPVEPGHEQDDDLHTISIKLGDSADRFANTLARSAP